MPLPVTPLPPFPGPGNGRIEWERAAIAYFAALPQFAHEVNAALAPAPLEPGAVPVQVPMAEARHVLLDAGLLQAASDYIATMPGEDGERARIDWEFQPFVQRASPWVEVLRVALEKTPEEIDAMFIDAAARAAAIA